jgi:hypothetical protein
MKLPEFELVQPHSLEEACSLPGEYNGKAAILTRDIALVVAFQSRLRNPPVYIRESAQNNEREIEQ